MSTNSRDTIVSHEPRQTHPDSCMGLLRNAERAVSADTSPVRFSCEEAVPITNPKMPVPSNPPPG